MIFNAFTTSRPTAIRFTYAPQERMSVNNASSLTYPLTHYD